MSAFVLSILWLTLLPSMLLPMAPAALVDARDGKLSGETVLGRRWIDLEAARIVLSVPIPGKYAWPVVHLVSDHRRWLLVRVSGFDDLSGTDPPETILAAAQKRKRRWYVAVIAFLGTAAWFMASIVGATVLLLMALRVR